MDALFAQTGVIRADTIDEMFDVASTLDLQPLPPGRRVAIVTNAGGPGILAADACEAAGLSLAEFSDATRATIATALPSMASPGNPIDMIASAGPDQYAATIRALMAAPEVDSLIVIFTPVDLTSAGAIMKAVRDGVAAGRRAGAVAKPVLSCVLAEPGRPAPLDADGERIPAFAFPENAARALGKATTYAEWRSLPPALYWGFDDTDARAARDICGRALSRDNGWLTDDEVRGVLAAYGIDGAAALARSADRPPRAHRASASRWAEDQLASITHRPRRRRSAQSHRRERRAARATTSRDRRHRDVLVQAMVTGSVEAIMGVVSDRSVRDRVRPRHHVEILRTCA